MAKQPGNRPSSDDARDEISQGHASHEPHGEWESCPPGTIGALIEEQRVLHRRAIMTRAAKVGMIGVIAVPAALLIGHRIIQDQDRQPRLSHPISCQQCLQLMADYQAKQLNATLVALVDRHLAVCNSCARAYARSA